MTGHNAHLRVDADKRGGLRVILVESRQLGTKRLDIRCYHMMGVAPRWIRPVLWAFLTRRNSLSTLVLLR